MPRIRISDSTFSLVLLFSFVPFMVKSVSYIEAGSYIPFLIMDLIGLPLIYGFYHGKLWVIGWLKIWAILMIIFGILRLGLAGLIKFGPASVEAQIVEQVNLGFVFLCLGYILAGFYIIRNRKRVLVIID